MKNNQSGRSMVEMLGVLAIIGVLSAGGLAGYSKAMFKHKLNSTMDQLTMLVTNIRTMYGTQENYNGLDVPSAYQLGIIAASSYTSSSSTMVNPFKGQVTLAADKAKAGVDDSAFIITYDGLPKEACIALATSDWGTGAGSGFIGVAAAETASAADTAVKAKYSGVSGEGVALKVSEAVGACTTDTNAVAIKFY